jgi:hypothetical protein
MVFGIFLSFSPLLGDVVPPAALPCGTQTLDSYVSLGNVGCSLGGVFDANSFTFSASAGAPLTANDIAVTPTVTIVGGTIVDINFNFSGNFSNGTAGPIDYAVDYILDPPTPVINGASLGLDPSGVLTENICAGGVFVSSVCEPSGGTFFDVLVATGGIPTDSTAFPSSVHTVSYKLVLTLQPSDSAGGFESGSVTGLQTSPIPEPRGGYLLLAVLLAVVARRFRVA